MSWLVHCLSGTSEWLILLDLRLRGLVTMALLISDCKDNRQIKVLGPQHFLNAAQSHFCPEVDSLGDHIRWASLREAEVIEGLESIDKTAPKALTDSTAMWEEDNGFVYYKGRLYVPNDHQLCKDIVKSCHDALTGGHPGKNGTIELVSCYYWWLCMADFISAYVEGCNKCQHYRIYTLKCKFSLKRYQRDLGK